MLFVCYDFESFPILKKTDLQSDTNPRAGLIFYQID